MFIINELYMYSLIMKVIILIIFQHFLQISYNSGSIESLVFICDKFIKSFSYFFDIFKFFVRQSYIGINNNLKALCPVSMLKGEKGCKDEEEK